MVIKTFPKNTIYMPFYNSANLEKEVYGFIDKFISNMESSTDISLAGWLYPGLNKTFYNVLTQTGYAGWSYYFDSPDNRKIFCVQAELKDKDREPTSYDARIIASLLDKLPCCFIDGENPAGFFDHTKYFIHMTTLDKYIMRETFKENIDALIFELSYPKGKYFNQGDIVDLYGLHFEYNIFDDTKLEILKYFTEQELTLLRREKIISKKQKKKAKESESFHLVAQKKLFNRIKNNMSALSSEATSSPVLQFLESSGRS